MNMVSTDYCYCCLYICTGCAYTEYTGSLVLYGYFFVRSEQVSALECHSCTSWKMMLKNGKITHKTTQQNGTFHMYLCISVCRTHWKPLSSPQATVVQLFGMSVVAGNGNLFQQEYRVCNITKRVETCPPALNFLHYASPGREEELIFSDVSTSLCSRHLQNLLCILSVFTSIYFNLT